VDIPAKASAAAPVKGQSTAPAVTKVVALIDVGFGNNLTIRGDGPGLSWQSGVGMVCTDGTSWIWSTTEASGPITFKVLANDMTWCAGEDYVVLPGETVTISPLFY
jgi:hypothetical protein